MEPDSESMERWARGLVCSATGVEAPLDEPAFLSPAGKPWLVSYELDRQRGETLARDLRHRPWTLWRYRELLPVSDFHGRVDLGEGGTPVLRLRRAAPDGVSVFVKNEAGNPTGSFKDRGLSLAVNRARELGVPLVIDSDAHDAESLDNQRCGVAVARRAWCEPRHVVNTLPVDSFIEYLDTDKPDRPQFLAEHG